MSVSAHLIEVKTCFLLHAAQIWYLLLHLKHKTNKLSWINKKNKLDNTISINEGKKIKQFARAAGELFDQIVICLKDHKI